MSFQVSEMFWNVLKCQKCVFGGFYWIVAGLIVIIIDSKRILIFLSLRKKGSRFIWLMPYNLYEISHARWLMIYRKSLIVESCSFISLLIEIQILYRTIDEIRTLECHDRVEIFYPPYCLFDRFKRFQEESERLEYIRLGIRGFFNVRLVHPQSSRPNSPPCISGKDSSCGSFWILGFINLFLCLFNGTFLRYSILVHCKELITG